MPLAIHNSDRSTFKRCRRKWHLSSPLRMNLEPKESSIAALWFGTGIHFALEDWHGWNFFGHPFKAFQAYFNAFRPSQLPADAKEMVELARGMLDTYLRWTKQHNEFTTYWMNGIPQVEVYFEVPLPIKGPNGEEVVYAGTFDRIVTDVYDRLWIVDYKTAKTVDTSKLDTDPQITSYIWAGNQLLDRPIEGVVYLQLLKAVPSPPKILKNGDVSVNKSQKTTYHLYRETLLEVYGSIAQTPQKNIDFLNDLAAMETPEGNGFIRQDLVRRSHNYIQAEANKMIAEAYDMLNPNLSLYPNPTRDCAWDCVFKSVCLTMDDGYDWEIILENEFQRRKELPAWRSQIQFPQAP